MTEPTSSPEPFEPPKPPERSFSRGPLVVGALLLIVGVVWLLAALDILEAAPGIWVGALLVAVGAALLAAPTGGHVAPLIVVGVIFALVGAGATAIDADLLGGGIGDRTVRPTTSSEVDEYELGIGDLVVDLTALDESATVKAQVGIGHLGVIVPRDARLSGEAHARLGNVRLRNGDHGGSDVHVEIDEAGTGVTLTLDLEVGIGEVEIGGLEVQD